MESFYVEMVQKITDSVYHSIEKMVKKLAYDRTVRARVTKQLSDSSYQVLYKNKTYTVSCDGTLLPNQLVWVRVPENNWDNLYVEAKAGTASGGVTGVKGTAEGRYRTGAVNLTPENLGLGRVDNTADSEKEVKSAERLKTARTINGIPFDGTADIRVTDPLVRLTKAEYDAMAEADTIDDSTYYLVMDDETT